MLNILRSTVTLGLEKPLKVLHISDSHIPLCDGRDSEQKQAIAQRKAPRLREMLDSLEAQTAWAEEHCDLIIHTGDLIDFMSQANLEFARKWLKNDKVLYIAGNHEYYDGPGWEDMHYRMTSVAKMGPEGIGANLFYTSRAVGGVNFVGIDDAYHQVEDWQTQRLAMEAEKGLPIVLFLHAPLFEQALWERSVAYWKDTSAYLVGCDEEHLMTYTEFRAVDQRPFTSTRRFVEYVNSEKRIKAVLAGHVHFNFESRLPGGVTQYVIGRGHYGEAREITFL
ncbi:MAG: metallophosphoesterase [Clostridia bacterium]|nr:metallophosphoesterase [Clostridia bacterium]